jgi:hypothetical protein
MILNQINVLPTQATLDYLSSVMADSPLDLDLSSFKVEIITTQDAVIAQPENLYQALPTSVRVWYDTYTQRSSLIISLVSSDLQRRGLQLAQEGVLREWYDQYNPHLIIKEGMPPLSRHYRSFIHSLANILGSGNVPPLEFTNEHVIQIETEAPINAAYHEAMAQERLNRRNE